MAAATPAPPLATGNALVQALQSGGLAQAYFPGGAGLQPTGVKPVTPPPPTAPSTAPAAGGAPAAAGTGAQQPVSALGLTQNDVASIRQIVSGLLSPVDAYNAQQNKLLADQQAAQRGALTTMTGQLANDFASQAPQVKQQFDDLARQQIGVSNAAGAGLAAANPNQYIQSGLAAIGAPQSQKDAVAQADNARFNGGAELVKYLGGTLPAEATYGKEAGALGYASSLPALAGLQGERGLSGLNYSQDQATRQLLGQEAQQRASAYPGLFTSLMSSVLSNRYRAQQLGLQSDTARSNSTGQVWLNGQPQYNKDGTPVYTPQGMQVLIRSKTQQTTEDARRSAETGTIWLNGTNTQVPTLTAHHQAVIEGQGAQRLNISAGQLAVAQRNSDLAAKRLQVQQATALSTIQKNDAAIAREGLTGGQYQDRVTLATQFATHAAAQGATYATALQSIGTGLPDSNQIPKAPAAGQPKNTPQYPTVGIPSTVALKALNAAYPAYARGAWNDGNAGGFHFVAGAPTIQQSPVVVTDKNGQTLAVYRPGDKSAPAIEARARAVKAFNTNPGFSAP